MRSLERELSELRVRINMHTNIYQQSSRKMEALMKYYEGLFGSEKHKLIMEDSQYLKAMERMKMAEQRLTALEMERKELRKKISKLMR